MRSIPTSFWTLVSIIRAGGVVDYPWWPLERDLNGIQLASGVLTIARSAPAASPSANHRSWRLSRPPLRGVPMTADRLIGSGYRAPCDGHHASPAGYEAFLAHLLTGIG